jgi:hypothetical protein
MANSTLLQLTQQVCNEIGIVAPTAVVTNTSQDIIQILALMNACGYELLRKHDWRALTKPYTFFTSWVTTTGSYSTGLRTITGIPNTLGLDATWMVVGSGFPNATFIESVDSSSQVTTSQFPTANATNGTVYFQKVKYDFPSDYDSIVPRTQWDKSKHWEMLGPEDAQQWEWLLSGFIATGPRVRWRLFGTYFQIWPGFSNAENLGFEYRSKGWAYAADGTPKNSFTLDTDTCLYPDRLMVLMCKYKYMIAKGIPLASAFYQEYQTELETDIAQDTSFANLSFAPKPGNILIGYDNIPDTGYGPAGS